MQTLISEQVTDIDFSLMPSWNCKLDFNIYRPTFEFGDREKSDARWNHISNDIWWNFPSRRSYGCLKLANKMWRRNYNCKIKCFRKFSDSETCLLLWFLTPRSDWCSCKAPGLYPETSFWGFQSGEDSRSSGPWWWRQQRVPKLLYPTATLYCVQDVTVSNLGRITC
jgi:hypothetical protein